MFTNSFCQIPLFIYIQTDKTMTELEIEANLKIKAEWDTIQVCQTTPFLLQIWQIFKIKLRENVLCTHYLREAELHSWLFCARSLGNRNLFKISPIAICWVLSSFCEYSGHACLGVPCSNGEPIFSRKTLTSICGDQETQNAYWTRVIDMLSAEEQVLKIRISR